MPNPQAGESRDEFLSRCIPQLLDEGKPQDQAVAACINIYEEGKAAERRFEDTVKYGHGASDPCAGLRGQELQDCRRRQKAATLPVPIQPPAL